MAAFNRKSWVLPMPGHPPFEDVSMQWISYLCVLMKSTHPEVQAWDTAALSSAAPVQDSPQSQLCILGFPVAKDPGRYGGPRKMCLGRIQLDRDRSLFQPSLPHQRIMFGDFYPRFLSILLTCYLFIYQHNLLSFTSRDVAFILRSKLTLRLHGFLAGVEPLHLVDLSL